MPTYRSRTTTHGRNQAGARGLWRATGMKDEDFGKPIIAIANSFTQFVPGHVHLKDLGQLVAGEIALAGGVAKEFNTIAVDDGIAMGHDGMLYSLPSRELIADSVEYMVNAHCADALVCISNCDKITPGMLMAAMRLNIPTVFVSGGPMEAGKVVVKGAKRSVDLIDAMVVAADDSYSDAEVATVERSACPTCGSCSGMFTANSMNCLTEALGLSLPGNGSTLATHADRERLFREAGHVIVDLARRWYEQDDATALPRGIASFAAFENAMSLDIAMGGSTNTVLHLLAAAQEGGVDFTLADIDRLSRRVPVLCKVAPAKNDVHMEDVHRAGGIMAILGELDRAGLLDTSLPTVHAPSLADALGHWDIARTTSRGGAPLLPGGAGRRAYPGRLQPVGALRGSRHRSQDGRDPLRPACLLEGWRPRGAVRQPGARRLHREDCRRRRVDPRPSPARRGSMRVRTPRWPASSSNEVEPGDVVVIRYEGPKGGPGMQEMLYPTSYLKSKGLGKACALVTDGRFSGGSSGLSIGHVSPEAAEGGLIALVETGDTIVIDIPNRTIRLDVDDAVLADSPHGDGGQGQCRLEAGGPQASRLAGLARLCGAHDQRSARRRARCQPGRTISASGTFAS